MASTRKKNQLASYNAQVRGNDNIVDYNTNEMKKFSDTTYLAGNGILQGHVPNTTLSENPVAIESFLFGMGANNFIYPQHSFQAKIKELKTLNMDDPKQEVIMPKPMVAEKNQRPFPV